jgi:cytochrome c oxidase subunit 3
MAGFSTTAVDEPLVSSGNGGGLPPSGNATYDPNYFEARLRRARVGMVVCLIGVLMIFVSLTSAYVVRQGLPSLDPETNTLVRDWVSLRLPGLLFLNTFVLLLSGISMEMARRQAAREAVQSAAADSASSVPDSHGISWLALTIVLGITFLSGQWVAWREMAVTGFYVATTPSSSFFYLLTGMHGVHLIGGVTALLAAGGVALSRRSAASQAVIVDVTAWYWHFMAVLWIYIFCLMKFLR